MIKSYIKNIFLIGFALIGPIHLPAGGIQRTNYLENCQQIVLSNKCSIYCSPDIDAKKIGSFPLGSNLSVLNSWIDYSKDERWIRIKLNSNFIFKNLNHPNRGWIRI